MGEKRFNWFYLVVGALFIAMLFISVTYFKGSGGTTVGIASSKDYNITSEKAALVKAIHVTSGQQVKKGDKLLELSSGELDMSIDRLVNKISVMKAEYALKAKMTGSEVAFILAEEGVTQEEIASEIDEITSELDLNRQLTGSVLDSTSKNLTPLQVRKNSLLQQKKKHKESMDIKIAELQKEHELEQTQIENEIKLLEHELTLLQEEKNKLVKFATGDGVIEEVYIKAGEQVDAFAPLLSIAPVHPTAVIAYVVGNRHKGYDIGAKVSIVEYGNASSGACEGKVIGYGSVSELPEILQKSTAVKAFGREIYIEISSDNTFANGQKVLVK